MLEEYLREQKMQRVDHPTHYNTNNPTLRVKCKCGEVTEVPIECIDVIRDMPSWKGNAIKYLWRAGLKSGADLSETEKTIEDLEKAIWYIKDKIEMIKGLDGRYRMDHAVTATQKTILAAFGMDDKTIRKKANELAEMLVKYDKEN